MRIYICACVHIKIINHYVVDSRVNARVRVTYTALVLLPHYIVRHKSSYFMASHLCASVHQERFFVLFSHSVISMMSPLRHRDACIMYNRRHILPQMKCKLEAGALWLWIIQRPLQCYVNVCAFVCVC